MCFLTALGVGLLLGLNIGSGCVLHSAHRAGVPAWEERDGDHLWRVDPPRKVISYEYRKEAPGKP